MDEIIAELVLFLNRRYAAGLTWYDDDNFT